jgi:hypothetical protein
VVAKQGRDRGGDRRKDTEEERDIGEKRKIKGGDIWRHTDRETLGKSQREETEQGNLERKDIEIEGR